MSEQSSSPFNTIIYIGICVILAFTNPPLEKHIQEVNMVVKKVVNTENSKSLVDNTNSSNQLMAGLGLLFGDGIVEGLSDKFISRDNYILFSITKVSFNGKNTTIGFGVLGNVIIFDEFENQLKELLQKKKIISEPNSDEKISNRKPQTTW